MGMADKAMVRRGVERRREARTALERPCKVFHGPSRRYLMAWTQDLSRGGALMRVDSSRPLKPGDEVEVLIAWRDRQLLDASDQVPAVVVRVLDTGGRWQHVGLRFLAGEDALLLPLAA